jgi:hypothetical protein
MTILQLDPPLPLTTPKGKATAHMVIDYGVEFDLLWVCFQDDTGECWAWSNPDVRGPRNITLHRENISPFPVAAVPAKPRRQV